VYTLVTRPGSIRRSRCSFELLADGGSVSRSVARAALPPTEALLFVIAVPLRYLGAPGQPACMVFEPPC